MSYRYKGRGFVQLTGRQNMSTLFNNSHNTITLSGASGQSAWNALDHITLNLDNQHHSSIKKFEMYETPIDVLTLSCTLQRMRANSEWGHKILDKKVVESVTTEDQLRSQAIRDYYSKKIMFGKLNDKLSMTQFRTDMNTFIHSDGIHFKEKDLGMICYLPTFYDYDLQLDEIKSQVTFDQGFRRMNMNGVPKSLGTTANLTPLKKITRKTSRMETNQYWMVDDKLNAAVVITLSKDNVLGHIWEHLFNNEKVLKITGSFIRKYNDEFEYFGVNGWKLEMA
jgi:hypothetical protein